MRFPLNPGIFLSSLAHPNPLRSVFMNRLYSAVILAMFVLHTGTAAASISEQRTSDIIDGLLPLAAFGTAYFKGDNEGEKQWLHGTVLHEVLYSVLVIGFNHTSLGTRPNGGSHSFP